MINKVSIALNTKVYTTFRNLVNTIPNALGEYVDNAVQSYLDHKEELKRNEKNYKLKIEIKIDYENRCITIDDNAAGIEEKKYEKAFEPAYLVSGTKGLNEFGMGLKTASVWFANIWTVTTKALNEDVERTIRFDLNKVIADGKEELDVIENPKDIREHYTKIKLTELSKNAPKPGQIEKLKKHLSSIYRAFLRNEEIEIYVNETKLEPPNYEILKAPYYKNPKGEEILWKKEINFDAGEYKAKGFIAILDRIQTGANGLVLLRRGRVIVGGGDEHFFPAAICGSSGTFKYKRIFGELELEGFDVTFNKNSFKAEDELQTLLGDIRDQLKTEDLNIFAQADNYRRRPKDETAKIAKDLKDTLDKSKKSENKKAETVISSYNDDSKNELEENNKLLDEAVAKETYEEKVTIDDKEVKVVSEFIYDTSSEHLYLVQISDNIITCKINLEHPFFTSFDMFKKANNYSPIVKILTSFALAEYKAKDSGTINGANIRNQFNKIILEDKI